MTRAGFPHSEISGSTPACGSPKLIAANHVLYRLLMPRHPPCALSSLTIQTVAFFFSPAFGFPRSVAKKNTLLSDDFLSPILFGSEKPPWFPLGRGPGKLLCLVSRPP